MYNEIGVNIATVSGRDWSKIEIFKCFTEELVTIDGICIDLSCCPQNVTLIELLAMEKCNCRIMHAIDKSVR